MLRPLTAPTDKGWELLDLKPFQNLLKPCTGFASIGSCQKLSVTDTSEPKAVLWSLMCHLTTEAYIPIAHLASPGNNPFSTLCHSILIPAETKTSVKFRGEQKQICLKAKL